MPNRLYPPDPTTACSIVARRKALGLSQNSLARMAGLTEAAITKYETLRVGPPPNKLAAIDRALSEAERKVSVTS